MRSGAMHKAMPRCHAAAAILTAAPAAWPRHVPPQALYPISSTSEGSYRDPAIVQIIDNHNSRGGQ